MYKRQNTHLNKFRFILEWDKKKADEKNELYSKHACHELNFWLSRKDTKYFKKVVVPHLKNKRSKTFMDHYLLGHDLSAFAKPWEFARLNTTERILLAEFLKDQRADLLRSVDESYWLNPITRANDDRLYDIAIRGLGLNKNQELEANKKRFRRDQSRKSLEELAIAGRPQSNQAGQGLRESRIINGTANTLFSNGGSGVVGGGFGAHRPGAIVMVT